MTATAAAPDAARGMTTGEFFALVREGRLVVQRCAACGALAVPPKVVCPSCEGIRWDRAALGGDGEIASYTVIRVPPAQYAADAPSEEPLMKTGRPVRFWMCSLTVVAASAHWSRTG